MEDLTKSIQNGAKDWETVKKNLLKEANDNKLHVDLTAGQTGGLKKQGPSFGHSALPSDVSPNAPVQGLDIDSRESNQRLLTSNFNRFRENKNILEALKKKRKDLVSENKKKVILKIFNDAMRSENTTQLVKDEMDHFANLSAETLKKINESIDAFNETVGEAIKVHGRGLGGGWSKLPNVNSYEALKDLFANTQTEGVVTILKLFIQFAAHRVLDQDAALGIAPIEQSPATEMDEAREKTNSPQYKNAESRLGDFTKWLFTVQDWKDQNKTGGYNFMGNMISEIESIFKNSLRLEIYNSITKELKHKHDILQKIGDTATPVNKEDIFGTAIDPEIQDALAKITKASKIAPVQPATPPEAEPINESVNNEPMTSRGKYPGQAKEQKHALDRSNDNKKKLEMGYQEYLKTKVAPDPKTDKPDEFTFIIG